jgi:hypothetical protein
MTFSTALFLTKTLLCFALVLQAIEIYRLAFNKTFQKIWSFEILKPELEQGLPLPNFLIGNLFSIKALKLIALLQITLAICGFFVSYPLVFAGLFATHLLICIRFRGLFNGGSDMMTSVLLTGVLISISSSQGHIQKLGLIYICLHSAFSYFKAGLVKVIQKDWRRGLAIPGFLQRSIYPDMKSLSAGLYARPRLSFLLSWGTLLFELAVPAIFMNVHWAMAYFGFVVAFHYINYLTFGLNRFFWVWLAAWPSILFVVTFVHS